MHAEGDRLVVTFRPVREPGAIPFMLLFVPLWTFGGIAVIVGLFDASWGDRAAMLFWLGGWAVAEAGLIVGLAWLFRGRELLIVTPEQFEVRKQIGRFARTKVYDATRIQTVEAALVPSDDEGPERKDFCLKLINEDASVQVGEGMTEAEAEDAAAAVRELIRQRRWWGEETDEPWNLPVLFREGAAKQSRRGVLIVTAVFVVLAVTTAIGFLYGSDGDKSGEPSTGRRPPPVSVDAPFLVYASANAHAEVVSAGQIPLGLPKCDGDSLTRHWVCTVRATTSTGKLVLFRCEAVHGGTRCARASIGAPAPRRSGPERDAPTSTRADVRSATP
ncbi:MAG: hypothetical protein ACJ74R_05520 [Gaiellaceae bacterium]